jgi:hypothetical protein
VDRNPLGFGVSRSGRMQVGVDSSEMPQQPLIRDPLGDPSQAAPPPGRGGRLSTALGAAHARLLQLL